MLIDNLCVQHAGDAIGPQCALHRRDQIPDPSLDHQSQRIDQARYGLAALDNGAGDWNDSATLILDAGVADQAHRPIWLDLELPEAAPKLEQLAGRVLADGDVVSTFEAPAEVLTTKSGSTAYHLTFPVEAGSYRAYWRIAGLDEPLCSLEAAPPAAPTAQLSIDPEHIFIYPLKGENANV